MADLLSPYLPVLRAAAARASRVPDEAEDLLQDALLEALRVGRGDRKAAGVHVPDGHLILLAKRQLRAR